MRTEPTGANLDAVHLKIHPVINTAGLMQVGNQIFQRFFRPLSPLLQLGAFSVMCSAVQFWVGGSFPDQGHACVLVFLPLFRFNHISSRTRSSGERNWLVTMPLTWFTAQIYT